MKNDAFLEYLIQFHCYRDYFECHEILEEHWKKENHENRQKHWVALIQIAVGMYHYRRKNITGAQKLFIHALKITKEECDAFSKLGIIVSDLQILLKKQLQKLEAQEPYESIVLPLTAPLLQQCLIYCNHHHLIWGTHSNQDDTFLIHKHTLRDRSDIIAERMEHLQKKHPSLPSKDDK